MKLNKMERAAMKFFDDGNVELTMQRLCMAAMLSPKQGVKKTLCGLIEKLRESKEETDMMVRNNIVSVNGEYTSNIAS